MSALSKRWRQHIYVFYLASDVRVWRILIRRTKADAPCQSEGRSLACCMITASKISNCGEKKFPFQSLTREVLSDSNRLLVGSCSCVFLLSALFTLHSARFSDIEIIAIICRPWWLEMSHVKLDWDESERDLGQSRWSCFRARFSVRVDF